MRRKERDDLCAALRSFGDEKLSPQDDIHSEELKFMATTLEQNTLEAQAREAGSKNDARKVRRGGKIPAVVYGAGKDSLSISVDPRHVQRILNSETGHNTIFDLALTGGEQTKAMIVDWQYEPIKGTSAAHRPEAHRARQGAARQRADLPGGRSGGREAGGRHHGADAARSRDRVLAGETFRATSMPTSAT